MIKFPTRVDLIRSMPPGGVGCEVGVLWGAFSAEILTTHVGTLHLVDPWKQYDGYNESLNQPDEQQEAVYHQALDRVRDDLKIGRVIVHRKMSVEAAADFSDGSLDWVFIDANHLFEFVLADLRAWAPKIKPNGWILGHDYGDCEQARELNFGVKEAVENFCNNSNWKLVALTDDYCASFGLKRE